MRVQFIKIATFIFVILLMNFQSVYSLNVGTHMAINGKVGKVQTPNGFSLNQYLIDNLGISEGVNELFNYKEVYKWLQVGGKYEDEPPWTLPYLRSVNHFHEPIMDQGFSGIWDTGFLSGDSAIVWALKDKGTQNPGGYYSWYDVRDYYYNALTLPTKTERDTYFAQTFRGLGQLMHLIQDASVPEHTRNDFHLFGGYEGWVKTTKISNYSQTFFTGTINNIASFIDTNQYNGGNPGDTVSTTIGLAEYSNANFFSEDTIFSSTFPYPNKSSTDLQDYIDGNKLPEVVTGEDNIPDTTFYIKKVRDGEKIEHFVKPGYFTNALLDMGATESVFSLSFTLDDNVYSDYASLLLPRAVGYSAGLLNYFFRGNMDFIIDANDREDGIKGVKISNNSAEDMNGTFSLYYDTADTNRHFLGSWDISLASQGTSQILSFSFPQDNQKNKYTLAFRGKMGTEKDAIAGYQFTGWREEWDNGLRGNHTWLYSGIDTVLNEVNGVIRDVFWGNDSIVGRSVNEVIGGKLIKENIRYAGEYSTDFHVSETLIMDAYIKPWTHPWPYCIDGSYELCYPYDFGEEFPIPITKDTWISIKIDEISINEAIPYQNCSGYSASGSEQSVKIKFNNGYSLSFTISGHEPTVLINQDKYWMSYVELGKEWSYNIFETFRNVRIEFVEPVNIKLISIIQLLNRLCSPSAVEHRQRMVVDYIRIQDK